MAAANPNEEPHRPDRRSERPSVVASRPASKRRWGWLILGVVVIAAIVVVGFTMFSGGGGSGGGSGGGGSWGLLVPLMADPVGRAMRRIRRRT